LFWFFKVQAIIIKNKIPLTEVYQAGKLNTTTIKTSTKRETLIVLTDFGESRRSGKKYSKE
jgi:hypothetical protein